MKQALARTFGVILGVLAVLAAINVVADRDYPAIIVAFVFAVFAWHLIRSGQPTRTITGRAFRWGMGRLRTYAGADPPKRLEQLG